MYIVFGAMGFEKSRIGVFSLLWGFLRPELAKGAFKSKQDHAGFIYWFCCDLIFLNNCPSHSRYVTLTLTTALLHHRSWSFYGQIWLFSLNVLSFWIHVLPYCSHKARQCHIPRVSSVCFKSLRSWRVIIVQKVQLNISQPSLQRTKMSLISNNPAIICSCLNKTTVAFLWLNQSFFAGHRS